MEFGNIVQEPVSGMRMRSPETTLYEGLKLMPFFEQRFARPVSGLYSGDGAVADDPETAKAASHTFLMDLLFSLPENIRAETATQALRIILNEKEHCPAPKEVRVFVARAALQVCGYTFQSFYKKAERFLAFPPKQEEESEEWINKVVFTAISVVGRDRFIVISEEGWAEVTTDVLFGGVELKTYEPKVQDDLPRKHHDFKSLLKPKS